MPAEVQKDSYLRHEGSFDTYVAWSLLPQEGFILKTTLWLLFAEVEKHASNLENCMSAVVGWNSE